MNEKYEIIIKENGEEITRGSAKGFVLMALEEDGIYNLVMVDEVSRYVGKMQNYKPRKARNNLRACENGKMAVEEEE